MSWQKVKLGDIVEDLTEQRKIIIKDEEEITEPTINTKEHKILISSIKKGRELKIKKRVLIKEGDLVFSKLHTQNGAFAFSNNEFKSTTTFLPLVVKEEKINKDFLFWILHINVPKLTSSDTVGRETYKTRDILNIEFNLPLIEEQRIIINKFLLLKEKINSHNDLVLQNLNLIKKLRQQILQEAVQGKLVPQDPKDEPASELLKKIKAEKEKLTKEGKIKREKPLPIISEEEKPYKLPKGWEWIRLWEACETLTQGPNPKYDGIEDARFRVLKTKDFYDNIIHYDKTDRISKEIFNEFKRFKLFTGDLIFGLVGVGSTSKCNIFIEQLDKEFILTRATGLIRLINKKLILPEYSKIILNSPFGKDKTESFIDGSTGQIVIKTSQLKTFPFPLPPLTEQKRIVEIVDKLMAHCNELEKQAKENQKSAEKLMEAVLRESFE